jgi:hypothetical protein
MATGKWTYEELTQLTNDLEEAPGPSMSVSPMVAPKVEAETEGEQEQEQEQEPIRQFRPIPWYRNPYGNNAAFVILSILACTFAYAIGRLLGAW